MITNESKNIPVAKPILSEKGHLYMSQSFYKAQEKPLRNIENSYLSQGNHKINKQPPSEPLICGEETELNYPFPTAVSSRTPTLKSALVIRPNQEM